MNSRRAPGQRLINLAAKADFIDQVDDNLAFCGYADRSQLIRDAMLEKINAQRKLDKLPPLPMELALPPGRIGKGGRIKRYPQAALANPQLNDAVSSAKTQADQTNLGQLDKPASGLPAVPEVPPVVKSAAAKAPQSIYGRPPTTRKRRKKK